MTDNIPADAVSAELIVVKQLPEIEERLRTVKEAVEARTASALAMVCTEETISAVKAERAKLNQQFAILEDQRKAAKKAVLEPYEALEAVYKECVSDVFKRADAELKGKINDVESEMKRRCEDGLRDYFAELCAVHHLEWLAYERAGVRIDMASAKAKTPAKLRQQLVVFVTGVAESVERISSLEGAEEIMVEFKRTLDAAGAICAVQERRRRIEQAKAEKEARAAAMAQEAEAARRVEAASSRQAASAGQALAPPVQHQPPIHILRPEAGAEDAGMCQYIDHLQEKKITVSLVLHPTKSQFENKIRPILAQLKQICDMEGIQYE